MSECLMRFAASAGIGKEIREKNERSGQGQVIPLFTRVRGVFMLRMPFSPRVNGKMRACKSFYFFRNLPRARERMRGGRNLGNETDLTLVCRKNTRIPHISLGMLYPKIACGSHRQ